MKKFLLLVTLLLTLGSLWGEAPKAVKISLANLVTTIPPDYSQVPSPREVEKRYGLYLVRPGVNVVFDNPTLSLSEVRQLKNSAKAILSQNFPELNVFSLTRGNSAQINIAIMDDESLPDSDEGYTIEIGSRDIFITARTPNGAFYALHTLNMLVENGSIPQQLITDYPDTQVRTAYLPGSETAKDQIERLYAPLKINHLMVECQDAEKFANICQLAKANFMSVTPAFDSLKPQEWWQGYEQDAISTNISQAIMGWNSQLNLATLELPAIYHNLMARGDTQADVAGYTVDISEFANISFAKSELESLALPIEEAGGVRFRIPEYDGLPSAITVNSNFASQYDSKSALIPIDERVNKLYFLHSTLTATGDFDEAIASYQIVYEDNSTIEVPIKFGRHIGALATPINYHLSPRHCLNLENSAGDIQHIWYQSWHNPTPKKRVKSVQLLANQTRTPIYWLGLSISL